MTNFSRKALKISLSSKLFSVLGTSGGGETHLLSDCAPLSAHGAGAQGRRPAQVPQQEGGGSGLPDCGLGRGPRWPGMRALTDLGEPPGYAAVDLVQNDDDHQVDDDRGGRDRDPDVGPHGRGGVHGQGGSRGNSVDDDAKDDGEGHRDLQREGGPLGWATWISSDLPLCSLSPALPIAFCFQRETAVSCQPPHARGLVALTS